MSLRQRYLQLALISVAGGAIYPLVYMRQNFELSMLEAFGISAAELQSCYALLGALFVLTYLPSGWLADRFRLRYLIAGSLHSDWADRNLVCNLPAARSGSIDFYRLGPLIWADLLGSHD